MCQIIKVCGSHGRKVSIPEPSKMKQDLIVYKRGMRIYAADGSTGFNMNKMDRIVRRPVRLKSRWFMSNIHTDFFYEQSVLYKIKLGLRWSWGCGWETTTGYYSYGSLSQMSVYPDSCEGIGEFVIPKGSKYYYNPNNGIYISNQIIFKKWIK